MLGYPDESKEEIENTINLAKKCMDEGLDSASFFLVMPLPGTPLFDTAMKKGYLPKMRLNFVKKKIIKLTVIPKDLLLKKLL